MIAAIVCDSGTAVVERLVNGRAIIDVDGVLLVAALTVRSLRFAIFRRLIASDDATAIAARLVAVDYFEVLRFDHREPRRKDKDEGGRKRHSQYGPHAHFHSFTMACPDDVFFSLSENSSALGSNDAFAVATASQKTCRVDQDEVSGGVGATRGADPEPSEKNRKGLAEPLLYEILSCVQDNQDKMKELLEVKEMCKRIGHWQKEVQPSMVQRVPGTLSLCCKFEPSLVKSVTAEYFMGDTLRWLQHVQSEYLYEPEELHVHFSASSSFFNVGVKLLEHRRQPARRLLLRQVVEFEYKCSQMAGWSRCGYIRQIIERMDDEERLFHMAKRIHFLGKNDSMELEAFDSLLQECKSKLAQFDVRLTKTETSIETLIDVDRERTRCHALVHDALGILYGKHPCLNAAEKLRKKLEHHREAVRLRQPLLVVRDHNLPDEILLKMDHYASFQSQGCARSLIASSLNKKEILDKLCGYTEALEDHRCSMDQLDRLYLLVGISNKDRMLSPTWIAIEFDLMLRNLRHDQQVQLKELGDAVTDNDARKLFARITEPLARIEHSFGCMNSSIRNENVCLLRESMVSNGDILKEQLLHWETKGFILDNPHINE